MAKTNNPSINDRRRYPNMAARLLANGEQNDLNDCYTWFGNTSGGYGRLNVRVDGRVKAQWAHRVSHEVFKGAIPAGYDVDHLCRNTRCINPEHLEAVPPAVNLSRRIFSRLIK